MYLSEYRRDGGHQQATLDDIDRAPCFLRGSQQRSCVDRIVRGLRPRMILNPVYRQNRGIKAAARRFAVACGQP